jgi:hypothetical protein
VTIGSTEGGAGSEAPTLFQRLDVLDYGVYVGVGSEAPTLFQRLDVLDYGVYVGVGQGQHRHQVR